jgi:transcriptional regulator with XRE-family HTH domain
MEIFLSELDTKEIGRRIRSLRGGATQQEFADRLAVGRTSIVRYEAGERTPDAEFIARAHSVLGADPIWLLTGCGEVPVLSPDESALLDNYRNSQEAGKAAIRATGLAVTKPKGLKKKAG